MNLDNFCCHSNAVCINLFLVVSNVEMVVIYAVCWLPPALACWSLLWQLIAAAWEAHMAPSREGSPPHTPLPHGQSFPWSGCPSVTIASYRSRDLLISFSSQYVCTGESGMAGTCNMCVNYFFPTAIKSRSETSNDQSSV